MISRTPWTVLLNLFKAGQFQLRHLLRLADLRLVFRWLTDDLNPTQSLHR